MPQSAVLSILSLGLSGFEVVKSHILLTSFIVFSLSVPLVYTVTVAFAQEVTDTIAVGDEQIN